MRVGIYGRTGHPLPKALDAGFRLHGHAVSHRELAAYQGEVEKFDLVMANGWRGGKRVAQAYAEAGIPVLIYDFGYLKRVNTPEEYTAGYWQVGPGGLNKIPAFECPPDRFDALEIDIVEKGGDPKGYVLVCGQVGGDAAHGLSAHDLRQWLRERLEQYPDAVFRPHPRGGIAVPGYAEDHKPLAESLAGARLVVTYNSNVGHDALLAGVPVVCDPSAAYAELAGEALPSVKARRAYFNRVAYGQWSVEEMASGAAQNVWINGLSQEAPGTDRARDARDVASDPDGVPAVDPGEPILATVEDHPDAADPGTSEDSQGLEPVTTDYSKLKMPKLRAMLTERQVSFNPKAKRSELLALLEPAT